MSLRRNWRAAVLQQALSDINMVNARKKKEEAVALLAHLLPEVESFQAEISRMQQAIQSSKMEANDYLAEKRELTDALAKEKDKSFEYFCKLTSMEGRCRKAESQLRKLAPELERAQREHIREEKNFCIDNIP